MSDESLFRAYADLIKNWGGKVRDMILENKRLREEGKLLDDSPLVFISSTLGLTFLDEEWKRVLALTAFMSLFAFVVALLGNFYFDPPVKENADGSGDSWDDDPDDYAWPTLSEAKKSKDGGNDVFLGDLAQLRPKWYFPQTYASEKLSLPLELYINMPENHFIQQHRFNFPFSLNCILLEKLLLLPGPPECEPAALSAILTTKTARFLKFAHAQTFRDLGLIKKSLLLLETPQCLLFVDAITRTLVLRILVEASLSDILEEFDFQLAALEIFNQLPKQDVLFSWMTANECISFLCIGQRLGGTLAALVFNLLSAHTALSMECCVFGCPPAPAADLEQQGKNVIHFVAGNDLGPRSCQASLDLFFDLLVMVDEFPGFSFSHRIKCLQAGKFPQEIELQLKNKVLESFPPRRFGTEHGICFVGQEKGLFFQVDSAYDWVASQPMFVGNWFASNSLSHYEDLFRD